MSYILPVGAGISGSGAGFGGAAYGMGIYRRNGAQETPSEQTGGALIDPVKNGAQASPSEKYRNGRSGSDADIKRRFDSFECQTCKNRKYQDGSDDSGVSFQTPTKIAPSAAASAVRGHEQEHVSRNQSKAEREDREIVSQSVTLHTGICPECGRVYISGGTTRTTTRNSSDSDKFSVGISDPSRDNGRILNTAA